MLGIDADRHAVDLRPVSGAARDFAHRLIPFWQTMLGSELIGAYLIGSLAHGGFSVRYSDVDMALITEAGLSEQQLARGKSHAAGLSVEWGPRLSIFWADRNFTLGRFPPLDRVDYLDHAVVLVEHERLRPPRPTLDEIQSYLRGTPFAGWADQARRFAASDALAPKDRKHICDTLPARPVTASYRPHGVEPRRGVSAFSSGGPRCRLIARALCASGPSRSDPLFPARAAPGPRSGLRGADRLAPRQHHDPPDQIGWVSNSVCACRPAREARAILS